MISPSSAVDANQPLSFAPRTRDPIDVLRAAFDSAPRGIVVFQEDGAIRFANIQASAIFDYPIGEMVGQPLSRLLPEAMPEPPDDQWPEFWKNPHGGAMVAARTVAGIRRDGERVPLEIRLRNFIDGATRLAIVWIVDSAERLNLEARLAAATHANLGFQRLIADVATRFGAVSPDGVDDAIDDSLRQIGEAMQLDWTALWRWPSGETHATTPQPQRWVRPSPPSAPEPFPMAKIPFVASRLEAAECCAFTTLDDLPEPDRDTFRQHGLRTAVVVPLAASRDDDVVCALALGSLTREQKWTPATIERLRLIAGVISQALARRARPQRAALKALDEIRRLRDRVVVENVELRREVKVLRTSRPIVSEKARPSAECSNKSNRSRPRPPPCCCSAKPARAKK